MVHDLNSTWWRPTKGIYGWSIVSDNKFCVFGQKVFDAILVVGNNNLVYKIAK